MKTLSGSPLVNKLYLLHFDYFEHVNPPFNFNRKGPALVLPNPKKLFPHLRTMFLYLQAKKGLRLSLLECIALMGYAN